MPMWSMNPVRVTATSQIPGYFECCRDVGIVSEPPGDSSHTRAPLPDLRLTSGRAPGVGRRNPIACSPRRRCLTSDPARRRSLRLPIPPATPKGGRSVTALAPSQLDPDRAPGFFVSGRELVARPVKGEERGSLCLRVDEAVWESRHRVALDVGLDRTQKPVRRRGFLTRQLARQDVDRMAVGIAHVASAGPTKNAVRSEQGCAGKAKRAAKRTPPGPVPTGHLDTGRRGGHASGVSVTVSAVDWLLESDEPGSSRRRSGTSSASRQSFHRETPMKSRA